MAISLASCTCGKPYMSVLPMLCPVHAPPQAMHGDPSKFSSGKAQWDITQFPRPPHVVEEIEKFEALRREAFGVRHDIPVGWDERDYKGV